MPRKPEHETEDLRFDPPSESMTRNELLDRADQLVSAAVRGGAERKEADTKPASFNSRQ